MGLQRNDEDIIIDFALTSIGRKKLAQGDFKVVKYAFGDDGIDYGLWVQTIGSTSQDAEILKTPIIEAPVDERVGLKYPLVTITDATLKYLPQLEASTDPLTLNERDNSQAGKAEEWQQNTFSAKRQVPAEILDGTFTLLMNNELIGVQGETPRSLTADNLAYYTLKRTDTNSVGGAKITVSIIVKALEDETWDEMGEGTSPSRWIDTVLWIKGDQSGLQDSIDIRINEALSR